MLGISTVRSQKEKTGTMEIFIVAVISMVGLFAIFFGIVLNPAVCSFEISGALNGTNLFAGVPILNGTNLTTTNFNLKGQVFCRDIEALAGIGIFRR